MNITDDRIKFLRLLSEKYRSRQQVCTEIINLQAILNLPKDVYKRQVYTPSFIEDNEDKVKALQAEYGFEYTIELK